MKPIVLTTVLAVAFWAAKAEGQCPWSRDPQVVELQSSCICNSSGKEGFNALSVQCQAVNFPMLMSALRTYTSDIILENLLKTPLFWHKGLAKLDIFLLSRRF